MIMIGPPAILQAEGHRPPFTLVLAEPPTQSRVYVQAWVSNKRYPLSPEGGHVGSGHPSPRPGR